LGEAVLEGDGMSYRNFSVAPAIAIFLLLCCGAADAKVLRWTCVYPRVSNANGVTGDQELTVVFTLDDVTGQAIVIGNAGKSEVEVFAASASITFLQRQSSGAIQVTSIDASGSSVQSRHRLIGQQLLPSQSYGHCVSN
jgi:hypothetical protein